MKTHKRKKSSRMHGRKMGTHGRGSRKKAKKSGHKGGIGMAGTGKRADQKKTLILNLYGHDYFGKQGVTSRGTERDVRKRVNVGEISLNPEKYGKKSKDGWEIDLREYKILGDGDVKEKLIIKAKEASVSALEKVKKAGGEIVLTALPKNGQTKRASESAVKKVEKEGKKINLPGKNKEASTK